MIWFVACVLVVTGCRQTGESLADHLELAGWDAVVATSTQEAVKSADQIRIDVVLMDEILADERGLRLEAAFKGNERLSRVPFVYMADGNAPDRTLTGRVVLTRPFTGDQLAAVLNATLAAPSAAGG